MDHSEEANKKELIMEYVYNTGKAQNLKDEEIREIILKVIESKKTIEEIKEDINKLITMYKEESTKKGEDLSEGMRQKESTSIYSTSPSGSMVITPSSNDDSRNELQRMIGSGESKEKEATPMHKESQSRVMVKANNNKGYASTMSITSSLGIIIGIIILLLLLLLLI